MYAAIDNSEVYVIVFKEWDIWLGGKDNRFAIEKEEKQFFSSIYGEVSRQAQVKSVILVLTVNRLFPHWWQKW
jgi:hypothetical protein